MNSDSSMEKLCCRHLRMENLPEDMVWEILKFLPTKSLMRFKTVSKLWLSTILDPNFAKAHRAAAGGLAIVRIRAISKTDVLRKDFFYANLDEGGDTKILDLSLLLTIPEDLQKFKVTDVVNGLVCFYNRQFVKLYNIATRELIDLPDSTCTCTWPLKECVYHLGFDSANKLYKLLKICSNFDKNYKDDGFKYYVPEYASCALIINKECEILTVSIDPSWRRVDPPSIPIGLNCISNKILFSSVAEIDRYFLNTFDLSAEKFHSDSNIPSVKYLGQLLGIGGNEAFLAFDRGRKVLVKRYYNEKSGMWTEMHEYNVKSKQDTDRICNLKLAKVIALPDSKVVIYGCELDPLSSWHEHIYVIDEQTRDIQDFMIRGPPASFYDRICWYKENIVSLKNLNGGR